MSSFRRDFLKLAGAGFVATAAAATPGARAQTAYSLSSDPNSVFDVKAYGARGDGVTIDTPAINKAIAAANTRGGGTVRFPPGIYACYSIHLKSKVVLYLEPGATILAAPIRGGFDNVAWIVPVAIFLLATIGTFAVVWAWKRRTLAMAGAAAGLVDGGDVSATGESNPQEAALRERIRRETEY